jgi:hypothetical protein
MQLQQQDGGCIQAIPTVPGQAGGGMSHHCYAAGRLTFSAVPIPGDRRVQAHRQRYGLASSALDHPGLGLVERSSGGPESSDRAKWLVAIA